LSEQEHKIVGKRVSYIGSDDCQGCNDMEDLFAKNKENLEIPVEFKKTDINSDDAKKIIEEKKLVDDKGNVATPFIQRCDVYEDKHEDCKEITGFKEDDWKDYFKKKAEIETHKEETVQPKQEESKTT
jgi:hypothetical protein